jgi:excisionase family DNA binding protein
VNLRDYLTTSDAAQFLGVSPGTVRNWERAGRLRAHRHPINDYRLFDPRDLRDLLRRIEKPTKTRQPGRSRARA